MFLGKNSDYVIHASCRDNKIFQCSNALKHNIHNNVVWIHKQRHISTNLPKVMMNFILSLISMFCSICLPCWATQVTWHPIVNRCVRMIGVWHHSTARAIRGGGSSGFRIALAVLWCHTLIILCSAASSRTHLMLKSLWSKLKSLNILGFTSFVKSAVYNRAY